jgi:hypothetical protein
MRLIPAKLSNFLKWKPTLHDIPDPFLPKLIFVGRLSPKMEMICASVLAGMIVFG